MKKILFASAAALALTGGTATAQNITFAGDARMGVVYNSTLAQTTMFSSRARLQVRMSRTTDSGMEVGARFRVHQAGGANTGVNGDVYIDGEFGRLTMGDIAGAVEGVVGNLPNIGYSDLRNGPQWLSNNAAGRTSARYQYSFDGFTVMLSSDQLTPSGGNGMAAIGVSYEFDGIKVSLGHETGRSTFTLGGVFNAGERVDHTMLGVEADIDMVSLKAVYGEARNKTAATKARQYGVSAQGTFDATTVTAYYMRRLNTSRNFGIGASYNLGGGAHLRGAVNRSRLGGVSTNTADFGITMSF